MKKFGIPTLLFLCLSLFAWIVVLRSRAVILRPQHCQKCNVVLVSIDSLRADHMSLYGYERKTTPNLDAWAKDALIFDNYSSAATLTPISQATVHTGLFPERNGLVDYQGRISPKVKTLPEILREEGYSTAGFTTTPDFGVYPGIRESFQRGLDHYEPMGRFVYPFFKILDWLKGRDSTKPFFLWVALSNVHWPYGTNAAHRFGDAGYKGIFRDIDRFPYAPAQNTIFQLIFDGVLYPKTPRNDFWFWNFIDAKYEWPFPTQRNPQTLAPSDLQHVRDLYDDNLSDLDEKITALWKALSSPEFRDNTVVVILTEHGEDLHEHGSFHHHDLWQTSLHVPLLVKSPALKPGRDAIPASAVDVLPSLLDHLGISAPNTELDGTALWPGKDPERPVFTVRTPLWENVLNVRTAPEIFDRFRKFNRHSKFKDYCVRQGKWKLIHRRSLAASEIFSLRKYVTGKDASLQESELYNLSEDPGETRNLAALNPEVHMRLKSLLLDFEERQNKGAIKDEAKYQFQEYF